MKPVYFDPEKDLAPLPFDDRICQRALQMKSAGLKWQPHVGCFVWDPEHFIKLDSPFPNGIYFVLSIPRFIEIFDNIEKMIEKLVWLPTWHQARLLCQGLGKPVDAVTKLWRGNVNLSPGDELLAIYQVIIDAFSGTNSDLSTSPQSELDKLSIAALTQQMGNISALPEALTDKILGAYHQFIEAYLNVLRQKENKPMDWFPRTLSIDPELADGMRHFYSDYQHITRKFFRLNQKLDRLREVHSDKQSKLFQDRINEIFELCAE
jgi:hypothetical protein